MAQNSSKRRIARPRRSAGKQSGLSGSAAFALANAEPPAYSPSSASEACGKGIAPPHFLGAGQGGEAYPRSAAAGGVFPPAAEFRAGNADSAADSSALARLMCQAHLQKAAALAAEAGISLADIVADSDAAAARAARPLSAIAGISLHFLPDSASAGGETAKTPEEGQSIRSHTQKHGGNSMTFWRI